MDRDTLLQAHALSFVGFCGQKRPNLDPTLSSEIEAADRELVVELLNYPPVLSYSSLERGDGSGNWVNLVVMRNAEGIERWRDSRKHAIAASDLAPRYYTTIRSYNGLLVVGSTQDAPQLILLRTKYYDFGSGQPWRAVREVSSPAE